MPALYSLVIISNSPIIRVGLQAIFQADPIFSVLSHNADGMELFNKYETYPQIFLLDIDHCDTLKDVVMRILTTTTGAKIVGLISLENEKLLMESIRLGLDGIIEKASPPETIFNTVKMLSIDYSFGLVLISSVFWSNYVAPKLLNFWCDPQKPDLLTLRELDVLSLLDKGCSNLEIAIQLVISPHTVKRHVEHLLKKFDAKDRHECVRIAHASGLLQTARRQQSSPAKVAERPSFPSSCERTVPVWGQAVFNGEPLQSEEIHPY